MNEPEFLFTDFAKFERPPQLHIAFQVRDEEDEAYAVTVACLFVVFLLCTPFLIPLYWILLGQCLSCALSLQHTFSYITPSITCHANTKMLHVAVSTLDYMYIRLSLLACVIVFRPFMPSRPSTVNYLEHGTKRTLGSLLK